MRHHFPLRLLAFGIATASLSFPALGQDSLEEVVITASRTARPLSTIPNTVTLIGEQDLTQQINISHDLSTVLGNMIPSFTPSRQKLTSAGESLRGRNPLYMVDGVPQSNPLRDGSRDGHTIDPLMLERIEVIHGANAIHGLGASGGIINLITRRPGDEWQQRVRLESSLQEEDVGESLGYGVNYSLSGREGAYDLLGSVSWRGTGIAYDANGRVIGFDNAQGDTMDADTLNVFLKGGYEWSDQRLELTYSYFDLAGNNDWTAVEGDYANGVPTTAEEVPFPGKPVSNEVTMLNLTYANDDILGQDLRLQVFDQRFAATYGGGTFATYVDPRFGDTVFDQSQNNSDKRGMKLTLVEDAPAGLPLSLVYGMDFLNDKTYQALILTGRNWVPESDYENLALFAQLEYSGIERLVLTAGLRHERAELQVDDFTTLYSYNGGQFVRGGQPEFSKTLPNIGATWRLTDAWRVFANYSEGFSMPDVGRVLRGINLPGQDVETFLNLEPIITENTELGLEYNTERFSAQLSYYRSDADFGQRLQANSDGIYSVLRERTEIDGYEFRTRWSPVVGDSLELRYARTDGQYDADGDNQVDTDLGGANMSPDRLNLSWEHDWTISINTRLQANVVRDRDFRDSSDALIGDFEGYTTVDLYAEWRSGAGDWRLGIQNLSNRDYYTYFAQTQGSDARNFKGLGRSYTLSYALLF